MGVVVQGTAVRDPYVSSAAPASTLSPAVTYGGAMEVSSGGQQPKKTGCNDPLFALLFYIDVAAIFAVAFIYGGDVLSAVGAGDVDSPTGFETYVDLWKSASELWIFVVPTCLGLALAHVLFLLFVWFTATSMLP